MSAVLLGIFSSGGTQEPAGHRFDQKIGREGYGLRLEQVPSRCNCAHRTFFLARDALRKCNPKTLEEAQKLIGEWKNQAPLGRGAGGLPSLLRPLSGFQPLSFSSFLFGGFPIQNLLSQGDHSNGSNPHIAGSVDRNLPASGCGTRAKSAERRHWKSPRHSATRMTRPVTFELVQPGLQPNV